MPDPARHQTNQRAVRRSRRHRVKRLMRIFESRHPPISYAYVGHFRQWDDLLDNWWTAAEWLTRWKRNPKGGRFSRQTGLVVCPPRPWINPDETTRRVGRKARRLP